MRTICEMLASFPERFQVRGVVTSSTEHGLPGDVAGLLASLGVSPSIDRQAGGGPDILRFQYGGISYAMMDTGPGLVREWEPVHGAAFTRLVEREAESFRPDLVLTFGGQPGEVARRKLVRDMGAAVVFGLRNHGYLLRTAFAHVDAVLSSSRYLSGLYESKIGLISTPMPVPLNESEVLADAHEPVMCTFVNPSAPKGVMHFARLAEYLCVRRPDIPFLVVESRGTAGTLVQAGLAGGFDLRRHANILTSPGVSEPRLIFAATRVLLVPSVWQEPSGRVAAEAMINGVPPIVSERGGLPETVEGAGFVLPLPDHLTQDTRVPVGEADVVGWFELIQRLFDDEPFYAAASARCRATAERFRFASVAPLYAAFFERVARRGDARFGPGIPS